MTVALNMMYCSGKGMSPFPR